MEKIKLKHLAREFELDTYDMRMALRGTDLSPPKTSRKRWEWPNDKDPHYLKCRDVIKRLALKKSGKST